MRRKTAPTGSNRASAICAWEELDVSSLRPAARRNRTHPAGKRRALEDSIREYGVLSPITINSANVIVDGHLRVEIARKLCYRTIPTIRIAHLNDAELRAYAIAANKLPAVANYNLAELRLESEEIRAEAPAIDLTLTGFTLGEVDRIAGNYAAGLYDDLDEADEPPPTATPFSKVGDLYALGDHRLICADSLSPASFDRLMDGVEADSCFTDPPYNVKVNGHVSSSGKHAAFAMASGEMTRAQFEQFLSSALGNIAASLREGAVAFVCMDHAHLGELLIAGDETFDARLNICVWDKGRGGMGSLWRSQCEHIAVFKKGTSPHLNAVELGKNGRNRTNVWSFSGMAGFGRSRRKALELHPTVKPVALIAEALLDVTGSGAVVLDPFGGSGSTLIAAERIGRRARLIELDPVYVDRTIARWEKLTGGKPELLERVEPQPLQSAGHNQEGEE